MRIRVWYVPYAYGINTRMVQNIATNRVVVSFHIVILRIFFGDSYYTDRTDMDPTRPAAKIRTHGPTTFQHLLIRDQWI